MQSILLILLLSGLVGAGAFKRGVSHSSRFSTLSSAASADGDASVDDGIEVNLEKLSSESAAFTPKTIDLNQFAVKDESTRRAPRQAGWLPLLLSPTALDGSMAGDVGFDPVGFASDKAALDNMREAEIKHSRLAMLAAAGWPLSELWHKEIADALGLESILQNDKAPSVLNGGLANEWIIGAGIFSLVVGGVLEKIAFDARSKEGYKVGNYNFDPLGLYSVRSSFQLEVMGESLSREEKIARAKFDMELCEIKNGRLAMLAIVADAAQEFISGIPVVQQSPFFFGDPMM